MSLMPGAMIAAMMMDMVVMPVLLRVHSGGAITEKDA